MPNQALKSLSAEELEQRINNTHSQIIQSFDELESIVTDLPNSKSANDQIRNLRELFTSLWFMYLAARRSAPPE